MKIAICFSGLLRDVNSTKTFWLDMINKHQMDVYASFWDDENESLGDTFDNFKKTYNPKLLAIENFDAFKNTTQDIMSMYINPPKNLMPMLQESVKGAWFAPMWYQIWKCNNLCKSSGIEYDIVIRARIDTFFDDRLVFIKNNMLNLPLGSMHCPDWGIESCGMIDCFAYGPPKIMDYYSYLFLQLMNYHNQGHYLFPPEHLLSVHFSKVKVKIRYFMSYMTISRTSKGIENDVYNKFVQEQNDMIVWSNDMVFNPNNSLADFRIEIDETEFL